MWYLCIVDEKIQIWKINEEETYLEQNQTPLSIRRWTAHWIHLWNFRHE